MTDPYEVLGVPRDATSDEIKRAYRERSRATHPDHGGDPEAFRAVKAAYDVLSDPEKRAALDRGEHPGETVADWLRRLFEGLRPSSRVEEMLARVATEVEESREAAESSAALTDLIEAAGVVGVEAALTPDEEDDERDLHLKAGIVALLDYVRGGAGRSPLQPEENRRERRSRAKKERARR